MLQDGSFTKDAVADGKGGSGLVSRAGQLESTTVKGKLSFILSMAGSLLEDVASKGWEVMVSIRMRSKLCREKRQLWGGTT